MQVRTIYIFTAAQLIALALLAWLFATAKTPWNAQRYVGTALAIIGVTCIVIARRNLGKSFAVKPEAHALVTRGVYSKIRNPIYFFGAVMLVGLCLVLQKPALWLLLPVLIIAQMIRAKKEARVLEAAFGEEYREYRRRTWF